MMAEVIAGFLYTLRVVWGTRAIENSVPGDIRKEKLFILTQPVRLITQLFVLQEPLD